MSTDATDVEEPGEEGATEAREPGEEGATAAAGTGATASGESQAGDGEGDVAGGATGRAGAAEHDFGRGGQFDATPTSLSSRLALVAALGSVVAVGVAHPAGGVVAALGLVLVAVGISSARLGAVVAGSLVLFAGVLVAGIFGAGPAPLVVATLGALVTWDLGDQAITLGEQVGHGADTRRGELVHAGVSLVVGGATGGIVLAVYRTLAGGFPVTALVVLLLAAAALASGLRP